VFFMSEHERMRVEIPKQKTRKMNSTCVCVAKLAAACVLVFGWRFLTALVSTAKYWYGRPRICSATELATGILGAWKFATIAVVGATDASV
jgi:hypothetical protein